MGAETRAGGFPRSHQLEMDLMGQRERTAVGQSMEKLRAGRQVGLSAPPSWFQTVLKSAVLRSLEALGD